MLLRSRSTYYKRQKLWNPFALRETKLKPLMAFMSLLIIGMMCVYSASASSNGIFFVKQSVFLIVAIIAFIFTVSINIQSLLKFSYLAYLFTLIGLFVVLVIGKKSLGATRWIDLGIFTIQPSELAKIAIILALARYFNNISSNNLESFKGSIVPLMLLGVMAASVAIQPDLATTIVITGISAVIIFTSGLPMWLFYTAGGAIICSIPIIWTKLLQPYQKLRVINFLNPAHDPSGSGYNVIQSKIAIGSGGFFGKGFLNGTQGQLNFLPSYRTDFIFTAVGEEFGFVGSVVTLMLYGYIIYYGFSVAIKSTSMFGKMISLGAATMLFIHVFVNIGMTMAIMPVAGIPLPFLSYGGTMLIVSAISFGLIVNADINQNINL